MAGMKRPSYLQRVAPGAQGRTGMAVLTPPRLLFRPSATQDLIDIAAPAPQRDHGDPRRPAAPPGASWDAAPVTTGARAPAIAVTQASQPPAPARTDITARPPHLPAPPRANPQPVVQARWDMAPPETPQQPRAPKQSALEHHTLAPGAPRPVPTARPPAQPPRDGAPPPRPIQPAPPPLAAHEKPAGPGSPASLAQIAAAARLDPPRTTAAATAPPQTARSSETAHSQPSPKRAETLAPPSLQPLPASPPPRPLRERPASGLHIGTIEIHVAPPPPPQPAARAPLRQAARPAAAPRGRIARGFGVFGLGQS